MLLARYHANLYYMRLTSYMLSTLILSACGGDPGEALFSEHRVAGSAPTIAPANAPMVNAIAPTATAPAPTPAMGTGGAPALPAPALPTPALPVPATGGAPSVPMPSMPSMPNTGGAPSAPIEPAPWLATADPTNANLMLGMPAKSECRPGAEVPVLPPPHLCWKPSDLAAMGCVSIGQGFTLDQLIEGKWWLHYRTENSILATESFLCTGAPPVVSQWCSTGDYLPTDTGGVYWRVTSLPAYGNRCFAWPPPYDL